MKEIKKELPYVVFKGKKYVRGFGLMEYKGKTKKVADEIHENKNSKINR